ncbi:MAG: trypsin-like peptidase domain-containing protein [Eubacterium sp.]|nr:trypsin-like peptidase domain-containing protein [Eubacterium sp.]
MDNGLNYNEGTETDFSNRYEGRGYYEGTLKPDNPGRAGKPQVDESMKRFQRPEQRPESVGNMNQNPMMDSNMSRNQNPMMDSNMNQQQMPVAHTISGQEQFQHPQVERVGSRLQFTPSGSQYNSGASATPSSSQYNSGAPVSPMSHQYNGGPAVTPASGQYGSSTPIRPIGPITTPPEKKAEEEKISEPVKAKKKKKGFLTVLKTTAAAVILGGFAGASFYGVNHYLDKNNDSKKTAIETSARSDTVSSQGITDLSGSSTTMNYDVATIAADVQPAIVSITTTVTTTYQYYFQQFEQESTGAGSGIIIGKDNEHLYIATNYHVVEKASEINVGFVDGEIIKARIKGYDANADIAVVTVDFADMKDSTAEAIKIATVGNSDELVVGEPVIAIGNALGYGQSVTVGYISALDRQIEGGYGTYIQTDAAINPGNSGGALINSKGQVVGINSIKYVDSKVEGMGFSIPSNRAMSIIENIIEGKDGKTYLGITGADISKEYAQIYGFPEGIYVKSVESSSPASEAGIHTGDIIVEFDGKSVYTYDELLNMIEKHNDGDKVRMTVYRADDRGNYKKVEIEAELGFSVTSH